MKYIKYAVLLICALFAQVQSQTIYVANKYKQVWYVSGTEKTHATFAAYDTSSLLISNTSNVPTITQLSATGTTLFKLDETGAFSNYAGSATLPWLLKTNFDDSLNNAHTITATWRFTNDLIPTSNGGADLGQISLQWDSLYAGTGVFSAGIHGSGVAIRNGGVPAMTSTAGKLTIAHPEWNEYFQLGYNDSYNVYFNIASGVTQVLHVINTSGAANLIIDNGFAGVNTTTPSHPVTIGDISGLAVKGQDASASTDSSWVASIIGGEPTVTFNGSNGAAYTQSIINATDQAVFAGASGGYDYDAPIILSNGITAGAAAFCTNAVKDTVAIASALSTDIYTFDWTSDPGSPGAHWYEAYAGGVYFYTDAATTGNPAYTWTRWGKN